MDAFPLSTAYGMQINRLRSTGREWPTEKSEFKDGSSTTRNLTDAPRRRWRLDYDAIESSWADILIAHYDAAKGPAEVFSFVHPYTNLSTSVRYANFEFVDPGRGPNPNVYPFLTIELEEVL